MYVRNFVQQCHYKRAGLRRFCVNEKENNSTIQRMYQNIGADPVGVLGSGLPKKFGCVGSYMAGTPSKFSLK